MPSDINPVQVIRGDCFQVCADYRDVDLIIVDPPYGGIVDEQWDRDWTVDDYRLLAGLIRDMLKPGGTAYVWGGIGTVGNRIFFDWLAGLESRNRKSFSENALRIYNVITWKKKRAYGKKDDYLFTREECAMLVKGNKPATFNIPLLDVKRGYAGYNSKYPAKSEYLRVTNVWDDISEIFRGKIHPCEKPSSLAARMIATSSAPNDLVV